MTQNSAAKIFFKILAASVTRYRGRLPSCKISEKINDPILRKFSDGRRDRPPDGQTDWQTDKSDFIGRCSTDVERPISDKFDGAEELIHNRIEEICSQGKLFVKEIIHFC